jgi:effector-binding domain-containing protein
MTEQPHIVERTAQPYVAIKVLVTMQELGDVVPPLNGEVFAWLAAKGVAPAGPPFWKYNLIDMQRFLEIEAGVAVAQPVEGDQRVVSGTLPGGRYASLHHTGHPSTLMAATGSLLDWASAQGLKWDVSETPDGERWASRLELYLTDPREEPDMTKWETELAFRLADA